MRGNLVRASRLTRARRSKNEIWYYGFRSCPPNARMSSGARLPSISLVSSPQRVIFIRLWAGADWNWSMARCSFPRLLKLSIPCPIPRRHGDERCSTEQAAGRPCQSDRCAAGKACCARARARRSRSRAAIDTASLSCSTRRATPHWISPQKRSTRLRKILWFASLISTHRLAPNP